MSKYIRTKDGIYEVIKNELGNLVKIDGGFIMLEDIKDKIIDQADTIEDLCDGFYLITRSFNENVNEVCKQIVNSYEELIDELDSLNKYTEVFNFGEWEEVTNELVKACGYIETDKGLIFVSEFKDKDMVLI